MAADLSPLEQVIARSVREHWMSSIKGVCTCGEVMYIRVTSVKGVPNRLVQDVVAHRAKMIAEALEVAGYGEKS